MNPMTIPARAKMLVLRSEVIKPVITAAIDPSTGKQLKPKIERTNEMISKAIPVFSSVVFTGFISMDASKLYPHSPQNF